MDLLLTIAAPPDRCAELLGDLASLREAAAKVEPTPRRTLHGQPARHIT